MRALFDKIAVEYFDGVVSETILNFQNRSRSVWQSGVFLPHPYSTVPSDRLAELLHPSADRRADLPNVAAQPAMSWIGIQTRVPEQ